MPEQLHATIQILESKIGNPRRGLPEEVFAFISKLTPMINVDLLIRDKNSRILLTWREETAFNSKAGWHIPGGIIRFKETFEQRINAVAKLELGATVRHDSHPLSLHQLMAPDRDLRGHFISLLYNCRLQTDPDPAIRYLSGVPKNGQWKWHDSYPEDMIEGHAIYRKHFVTGESKPYDI